MRLRELNPLEIGHYGYIVNKPEVYKASLGFTPQIVTPIATKSNEFINYNQEIFLEPVEGVGVIFLTEDDGPQKMYLFDRAILLKPNVWFCVLPYHCEFRYHIFVQGEKSVKHVDEVLTAQGIYPNIKVDTIYTVLYQEKDRFFDFHGEKHPFWELTYVDSGAMSCIVDQKEYELKQGDLIYFMPNQFHRQRNASKDALSFFTVSFDVNLDNESLLGNRIIRADTTMHKLLRDILTEYNMDMLFSNEMILSSLVQMIILSIRSVKNNKAYSSIPTRVSLNMKSELISRCVRLVDENIGYKLTADFLSKRLSVSPSYLSKLFRQEMGMGLSEYVKERRLELARYHIKQGNYTITQISDMLGYCSVCYMSTEFKKRYKLTPSEYSKSVNFDSLSSQKK